METIHLEFPKKDGILLTKKGLMKVNYYKELVVVKPLTKSKSSLDLLRNYLKQKLMRELKLDQLNHRQPTESISNLKTEAHSESEETENESSEPADQSSSDPTKTLNTLPESTKGMKAGEGLSLHASGQGLSTLPTSTETSFEMPPLLAKWTNIVLETMTKDPETVGRKMGKVDLDMKPAVFLGNHPLLHRTLLHRMVRFMRSAYKDHKSEDILVIHREQRPVPRSNGDTERHTLSIKDALLLLPTTLSQSAAHLRFELGTHFCRKCKITMTVNPGEEVTCECGGELEILRCMGTIHSHGSMGAFSSGTDNKHEIPHIGFHMTVGNLDRVQESLVVSFCDGEVRIPLNISDLFATEKDDRAFDGQIDNWILLRRESKKAQEEERKKAASSNWRGRSGVRNIKIDVPSSSTEAATISGGHRNLFEDEGVDPVLEEEGWGEEEEWEDDNLAVTRAENLRDKAIEKDLGAEHRMGVEVLLEMVGEAYSCSDRTTWPRVKAVIQRCSWSMEQPDLERLTRRVGYALDSMTAADQDYGIVSALLEHLEFVSKTDRAGKEAQQA